MSDSPEAPAPVVQPDGRKGGPDFHKPNCRCNACVARRRKAEAIALGARPEPAPEGLQSFPDEVLTDTEVMLSASQEALVKQRGMPTLIGTKLQRDRIKKWLQWKAIEPKLTHADAAARLDIAPQTLNNLIHEATKAGWLKFDDPMAELEYEIIPDANRVIKNAIRGGDTDTAVKLSQATIWKQYAASKGVVENAPTTVLALKIEMPAGMSAGNTPSIKGVIVGQPRVIDVDAAAKDEE